MRADELLYSQNAHIQNVLVRCAQWKLNQLPSLKRQRASLEGPFESLPLKSYVVVSMPAKRQDAQKGRSARPQRAKRRGVRFGTSSV